MRKLQKDLATLIKDGHRVTCEELINLAVANFTTHCNKTFAVADSTFHPTNELTSAQGGNAHGP